MKPSWSIIRAIRRLAGKSVSIGAFPEYFSQARDMVDSDSQSGVLLNKPFAQSVWLYGAITLISRTVARTPFILESARGNKVSSGRLYDLMVSPNPRQGQRAFITKSITRLLLDGHTFIERRGLNGQLATSLEVTALSDLTPEIGKDSFGEDFARFWVRRSNQKRILPGDEIFEWKLDNPYDRVYGLPPILAGALAIYSDVATGVFNRAFFENGATPGVTFTTDNVGFNQDEAERAQKWWNNKRQGAKNAHGAAFLGNGLKPNRIAASHADMEFSALKNLSKSEILAIYQVPATLLGESSPQSGVSIGGADRKPDAENFYLNTVMPWAEAYAEWWNKVVAEPFGNERARFDFSNVPVLQDRQLDRAKEGREWIKAGVPLNEVNRVFDIGFNDQDHGNEFWVPANMVPARLLMDGPIPVATGKRPGEVGVNKEDV